MTKKIGSPLNSLQNKLGVRAQINRLILAPAGLQAFDKLVRLLDGQPGDTQLRRAFVSSQVSGSDRA